MTYEGNIYGYLLVKIDLGLVPYGNLGRKHRKVLAECLNCSSGVKTYQIDHLKSGHTNSCSCYNKQRILETFTTHGMTGTRQYRVWAQLKERCLNKNHEFWEYYGGRGITVCDKWLKFQGFWEDMKENYSDDLEIDRIDVNGNYCKENCRWTTIKENAYNKRMFVNNTSGRTGVYYRRSSSKYRASVCVEGSNKHLGLYDTFDEAVEAREKAELEIYGYNKK